MNAAKYALLLSAPMFLTACGGASSDGGGGGSSVKPTTYTWQFVQMRTGTAANMAQFCNGADATIFNVDDRSENSDNWIYTYAVKAPSIEKVLVFNADGSLDEGNPIDKTDIHQVNGTLTFPKSAIPDGGYLTIVDKGNGVDNILSVEKAALSDSLVKVNYNQGQQACYTGGNINVDSEKKKVVLSYSNNEITKTSTETYLDGKSDQQSGTIKDDLTVLANGEYTLMSGYNNDGDIIAYKFAKSSELSDSTSTGVNAQYVELENLQDNAIVDFTNTASATFSSLSYKAIHANNTFEWFSWGSEATSFEAKAPLNTQTSYSAYYQGTLNGWDIKHNKRIQDGYAQVDLSHLDLDVPSSSIFLDCASSQCNLNISDITTLNAAISKLSLDVGTAKYTVISTKDLIVPNINGIDYPDTSTPLRVSLLLSNTSNMKLEKAFRVLGNTRNYNPSSEYIDLILKPSEDLDHQKLLLSNDYTLITK